MALFGVKESHRSEQTVRVRGELRTGQGRSRLTARRRGESTGRNTVTCLRDRKRGAADPAPCHMPTVWPRTPARSAQLCSKARGPGPPRPSAQGLRLASAGAALSPRPPAQHLLLQPIGTSGTGSRCGGTLLPSVLRPPSPPHPQLEGGVAREPQPVTLPAGGMSRHAARDPPVSGPRGPQVPHDPACSHKTPTESRNCAWCWARGHPKPSPPSCADRALEGNYLKYFRAKIKGGEETDQAEHRGLLVSRGPPICPGDGQGQLG